MTRLTRPGFNAGMSTPLCMFYEQSLSPGNLLQEWRKAKVTAVFKKGCKYQADNYRPISLTSLVVKI